ncbi:hypothetical protein JTB14_015160 [Gonioctena quinquepunctata]|nr:hypothetical protein JTB14_015160 [Gonioctena quinquepunctata]
MEKLQVKVQKKTAQNKAACFSALVSDGAAIDFCLQKFERVDIVFDRYFPGSLKADIRLKIESGKKMVVRSTTPLPKVFSKFLQSDNNKKQLFKLLLIKINSLETNGKLVICTDEESVTSVGPSVSSDDLAPCSHEEADTRLRSREKCIIVGL